MPSLRGKGIVPPLGALFAVVLPVGDSAAFDAAHYLSWGEQGVAPEQFVSPFGIASDHTGYVYVVEHILCRVQKFDGFGNFVLTWGEYGGGPGQFLNPEGVAVGPDGLVYVADARNRRVQVFTTNGAFVRLWETPTPGPLADRARDIAFDSGGTVYVTFGAGRVEKYTSEGIYLSEWDIPGNEFNDGGALGIAISSFDEVYVVDPTANWSGVRRFDVDGTLLGQWGGLGSGPGQFDIAIDVAVDDQGQVFVTDRGNHRVQVFTASGAYVGEWGGYGAEDGEFNQPQGLVVNPNHYIFVVDTHNHRVQKFGFGPVSLEESSWGRIKASFLPQGSVERRWK